MPDRSVSSVKKTTVRHVATPLGRTRENGPHLVDLREFVEASKDLPGETLVRIEKGHLSESGRYDVTFTATHAEALDEPQPQAQGGE